MKIPDVSRHIPYISFPFCEILFQARLEFDPNKSAPVPRYPPYADLRDLPRIWMLDVSCLGGYAPRDKLDLGSWFSPAIKIAWHVLQHQIVFFLIQKSTGYGQGWVGSLGSEVMRSIDKTWQICRSEGRPLPFELLGKVCSWNDLNGLLPQPSFQNKKMAEHIRGFGYKPTIRQKKLEIPWLPKCASYSANRTCSLRVATTIW